MSDFGAIVDLIRSKAPEGARIVFLSGDFNVIHPGHLRIINYAASCGDFLVVGVNSDKIGWSMVDEHLRCEGVAAISVVGHAFILTEPATEFIRILRPDVVVKGQEFTKIFNPELEVVESYGGALLFSSGDVRFSTRDLLAREINGAPDLGIVKPVDYLKRHNIHSADLDQALGDFSKLRLVVIGDLIVDEYIDCTPLGMSREDPTLVVTPVLSEKFVGGAGIVAAHGRSLGANVAFFTVAGDDETMRFADQKLRIYDVAASILIDESRPTTLKQRYRAAGKTLLRVSQLLQNDISPSLVDDMFARMLPSLEAADLVIFSDFNYGALPQELVDKVTRFCLDRSILMAADSQASSQLGDVSRFKDVDLMTPTEYEARLADRNAQVGLVQLADDLHINARAKHVIITLGSEGILIHWRNAPAGVITDQLPAMNTSPRDVSGAGDSLLVCTAMALAVGRDVWEAAYLGSIAAACQVSRKGNTPISRDELRRELLR